MTSGNGLPAASECDEILGIRGLSPGGQQGHVSELDSQPIRDIENIIAELEVVNRRLSSREPAVSPSPSRGAGAPSLPE
jgi:hypothetical protein